MLSMGRQRVPFLFMYPDKEKKEPLPAASLTIKWGGIGIILIIFMINTQSVFGIIFNYHHLL